MYCIIKCNVQGKQARVKNADLRHPSCTVVMQKRKSASPILNVLSSGKRALPLGSVMTRWLERAERIADHATAAICIMHRAFY